MGDDLTLIVERIRRELNLQFVDSKHPGLHERRLRLRALFKSVPASRAKELHARLGISRTPDPLSQLFHGRLATETRQELLKILQDIPSVPTPPAPSAKITRDCRRDTGFGQLLPWERNLLALIHDVNEADFKRIGIFIGPVFFPGAMAEGLEVIVRLALKANNAITIGTNIWFPRAIDTSSDKLNFHDIGWVVHESVHVMDYQSAGTEAFLKGYVQSAIAGGFSPDNIPSEKRANRIESAAKRLIQHFPDLANAIRSCDGSAISTLLTTRKGDLRTFFRGAL